MAAYEDKPLLQSVDVLYAGEEIKEHLSIFRLAALNAFVLVYGALVASMGVIILPKEMERMFEAQHAIYLGIFVGLAGFSQLVCPLAGFFSDRCTLSWGRRRPYFAVSGVCMMGSLIVLWWARNHRLGWVYFIVFFLAMTVLNVGYACFTGLVTDVVPPSQMGTVSGMMGVMTMIGSLLALSAVGWWVSISGAYLLYAGSIFICVVITCLSVDEVPLNAAPDLSWTDIVSAYRITHASHGDFYWVFVGRTLYYMAVSVQTFILFYLRDVIHVHDAKTHTAILCMVAQLSAAIVSLPMGKLSDKFGRKSFIYLSCTIMSCVYTSYIFARSFTVVCILGTVYGVGNGMYIAVDYALANETLPDRDNTAKDLGLWGISAFLGMMVGPVLAGPLLFFFGQTATEAHYSLQGYCVLMLCGTVMAALSGCVVTRITSVR